MPEFKVRIVDLRLNVGLCLLMALSLLVTACADTSTPTVASVAPTPTAPAPTVAPTLTAPAPTVAPTLTAPAPTVVPPAPTAAPSTPTLATPTTSAGPTSSPAASVPAASNAVPLAPDEKEVTFTADKDLLYATLLVPNDGKPGKKPAVLILPTAGPLDRNNNTTPVSVLNNTHLDLARVLADQGVASLRYDKLGFGKTGLASYASHPSDINYPVFVAGARAAYDFLKNQPEVDPNRLMLLGHSEGSLTALVVAEQLKGSGGPKLLMLAVAPGASNPNIPRYFYDPPKSSYFYDPLKIAAGLPTTMQVLLVCGDKDTFVKCDEVKQYVQAFEKAGNKDVSFYQIANMNHDLKHIAGEPRRFDIEYADLTLKFSPEFISRLSTYVKTKL